MIHVGILEWHNGLCARVTNEHALEIYVIHGRIYIYMCVSVYAFYRKIGEWDGLFGGIEASAWK